MKNSLEKISDILKLVEGKNYEMEVLLSYPEEESNFFKIKITRILGDKIHFFVKDKDGLFDEKNLLIAKINELFNDGIKEVNIKKYKKILDKILVKNKKGEDVNQSQINFFLKSLDQAISFVMYRIFNNFCLNIKGKGYKK